MLHGLSTSGVGSGDVEDHHRGLQGEPQLSGSFQIQRTYKEKKHPMLFASAGVGVHRLLACLLLGFDVFAELSAKVRVRDFSGTRCNC